MMIAAKASIEFIVENGGGAGVRLRTGEPEEAPPIDFFSEPKFRGRTSLIDSFIAFISNMR
jgi:hypothetical protein